MQFSFRAVLFLQIASWLALLPSTFGHVHVQKVYLNGKITTQGVRQMGAFAARDNPANTKDFNKGTFALCRDTTQPVAPLTVRPGDNLTTFWQTIGGNYMAWEHRGYCQIYMAESKDGKVTPQSRWFKVYSESWNGGISCTERLRWNHRGLDFIIPKGLKDGRYVFRPELSALLHAGDQGMNDVFPTCLDIVVQGGQGTKTLVYTPTVTIPSKEYVDITSSSMWIGYLRNWNGKLTCTLYQDCVPNTKVIQSRYKGNPGPRLWSGATTGDGDKLHHSNSNAPMPVYNYNHGLVAKYGKMAPDPNSMLLSINGRVVKTVALGRQSVKTATAKVARSTKKPRKHRKSRKSKHRRGAGTKDEESFAQSAAKRSIQSPQEDEENT